MVIQVNIKWSVVITGDGDEVVPLFLNKELRDRYVKGIVPNGQKPDDSELLVYTVTELTEVLVALDRGRQEGKQINWEIWCNVGDPEGVVTGTFALTEKGRRKVT